MTWDWIKRYSVKDEKELLDRLVNQDEIIERLHNENKDRQEKIEIFENFLIEATKRKVKAEKELRDHKDNPLVFLTRSEADELRLKQVDQELRMELKDTQIKNFKIERRETEQITHSKTCICKNCSFL